MSFWTTSNIKSVTAGAWLQRPAAEPASMGGLSTDTRAIKPGQVFLALRGENFDGHDYLSAAIRSGTSLLVVDNAEKASAQVPITPGGAPVGVLKVPDTRQALLKLGGAYRRTLEGTRVVAVLGANGKTTTTRLIDTLLRTRLRGSASPKSFNNDIGVPLTILGAKPDHQYLVCEVGTNHPGEIAALAPVVQPDIVVITSVGRAHIEHFGTLEAIIREDAAIFPELRAGGLAILPHGDAVLAECAKNLPNIITFGRSDDADLRITHVEHVTDRAASAGADEGAMRVRFTLNDRQTFEAPLIGEHNALNATAAIAVARRFALDDAAIREGLAAFTPADMRLNRREIGGVRFIVDCYNANPESAASAVRTFAAVTPGAARRIIVLGDMLELGDHAPAAHHEIGELIAREGGADVLIAVGPLAAHAGRAVAALAGSRGKPRVALIDALDTASISNTIAVFKPGDAVLLKGSRGAKLERLLAGFEKHAQTSHERATASAASST